MDSVAETVMTLTDFGEVLRKCRDGLGKISAHVSSWTQGAAKVPCGMVLSSLAAVPRCSRERCLGIPGGTLAGMPWWSVGKVAGASCWYQLVPTGTNWYQLVSAGARRYQLVPAGTSWCQLVPAGNRWFQLVPAAQQHLQNLQKYNKTYKTHKTKLTKLTKS